MKALKKVLSLALTLAMLLSIAVPAMADEPDFTLTLDKASYTVGDTAYVTVKLNKTYTMCNLNIRVWYDPEVFTYDKENSKIGEGLANCNLKDLVDPVASNYNKLDNFKVNGWKPVNIGAAYLGHDDTFVGTLAVIAFTVIGESESAPFSITLTELSNDAMEDLDETATVGAPVRVETKAAQTEPETPVTPFTRITTADGAAVSYEFKGMISADAGSMQYEDGPYYHVTIPAGTESVLVTYPADVEILGDPTAYSYTLSVPDYELDYGSETFDVKTNEDGSKTVTIPVESFLLTDGAGTAMSLEKNNTFDPITFFSFAYAADSGTEPNPTPSEPEEKGYSVSASADQEAISVGNNATVTVQVSGDEESYNAYDLTLTYDTEKLTYVSGVAADESGKVTEDGGTIRVVGYGKDKTMTTPAVTLTFTGKGIGDANVKITSAKVDIRNQAIDKDAPEATIASSTTAITIGGYTVNLGEGLSGSGTVAPNGDYTFNATDWANYDYVISATMGGNKADVIDNKDGTYTIKNVTGNLEISATMTAKSYDVTINGEDTTGEKKATYNTPYTFTVDQKDGFTYDVAVTVGGNTYTGYTVKDGTYTIPGTDITGEIVITVTKEAIPATYYTVTVEGFGAGDVTAEKTVKAGEDLTFKLNKATGFTYTITAKMGGKDATVIDNEDGTYTIQNATGDIMITVDKESDLAVDVKAYITLNEKTMYLVTVSGTIAEGSVAKYDGQAMYWSAEYKAYAWLLVSADDLDTVKTAATEKVTVAEGTAAGIVDYSGDVNGTQTVDVNDAQLTYDIYNTKYDSFDKVSMLKFLNADTNADKTVNVEDTAKIVKTILGN